MDLQASYLNNDINSLPLIDSLLVKQGAEFVGESIKKQRGLSDSHHDLELFLQARQFMQSQDWQSAAEAYRELVKIKPLPSGYCLLGLAYFHLEDFHKAAKAFEKTIELDPQNSATYTLLGLVYIQLNKLTKALPPLRRALRLNPNQADAYFLLGFLQSKLHHWQAAIDAYREAIRLDKKYIPAYFYLAKLYWDLSQKNKSKSSTFINGVIETYEQLLEVDPRNVEARIVLGELYHSLGRLEDAEKVLEKALKLDPKNADALNQLRLVKEDQLEHRLFNLGFLKKINEPITDFTPYKNRKLIKLHGKLLSETVIEERR